MNTEPTLLRLTNRQQKRKHRKEQFSSDQSMQQCQTGIMHRRQLHTAKNGAHILALSSVVMSQTQTLKHFVNMLMPFSAQEDVMRCHRYCNHGGGQAAPKVER